MGQPGVTVLVNYEEHTAPRRAGFSHVQPWAAAPGPAGRRGLQGPRGSGEGGQSWGSVAKANVGLREPGFNAALSHCAALRSSQDLSGPQFSHLQSEDNDRFPR